MDFVCHGVPSQRYGIYIENSERIKTRLKHKQLISDIKRRLEEVFYVL